MSGVTFNVNVNMDLDTMFRQGLETCQIMDQFGTRGVNKRCLAELDNEQKQYKRSRHAGNTNSSTTITTATTTTSTTTINNNNNSSLGHVTQGTIPPKITTTTTTQKCPQPRTTFYQDTTHLLVDTQMGGCQEEYAEYNYYLDRNAYGYRDH